MASNPHLASFVPDAVVFEIDGDHVYVGRGGGERRFCFPISVFRQVHRRAAAALAAHDAKPTTVAPACIMCPSRGH